LPPVLHRQAEADGHRRPRRTLPPQVRQEGSPEGLSSPPNLHELKEPPFAEALLFSTQIDGGRASSPRPDRTSRLPWD